MSQKDPVIKIDADETMKVVSVNPGAGGRMVLGMTHVRDNHSVVYPVEIPSLEEIREQARTDPPIDFQLKRSQVQVVVDAMKYRVEGAALGTTERATLVDLVNALEIVLRERG